MSFGALMETICHDVHNWGEQRANQSHISIPVLRLKENRTQDIKGVLHKFVWNEYRV
jgi:hypothetical protein